MTAGAVLASAVTLILTPILIGGLSRVGLFDHPNSRSSHDRPTIRGGGLALASGALVAAFVVPDLAGSPRLALIIAAGLFGLLGMADDLFTVSAPIRLLLQPFIALLTLPPLLNGIAGPAAWRLVAVVGVSLWLVSFVNVCNFMDGINGLAVAQAIVAGTAFALIGSAEGQEALAAGGSIIGAASLAFAPFNFPKPSVFLGDVGSYFLGAWLAVLVVIGLRAGIAPEALLAPVAIFGADTSVTLVRRITRGAIWFEAHREHTYQRLVGLGWSHARTTGLAMSLMAACGALGAVSLRPSVADRVLADALILVLVGAYLVAPWMLQRRDNARLAA